jgi:putative DNA primase/helicase
MTSVVSINSVKDGPSQAIVKLSKPAIDQGFEYQALHEYTDIDGNALYCRVRYIHHDGRKWIRPIYRDLYGNHHLGEPPSLKGLPKPLYGLHLIKQCREAIIYVLEGEWPTDGLNKFFFDNDVRKKYIAITSGSATSATAADWQPLAGRTCVLWADNDEPGQKYITQVSEILTGLGCSVQHIDVAALHLPQGGDFIDWLQQ